MTNFNFISITNTGLDYYVYFEKVKAAKNYDVLVYDSSNYLVYRDNIESNSTIINFDSLNYNEVYNILVIAYDEDGNSRNINEKYTFLWNGLSFSKQNEVLMDNELDYTIYFDGDYKEKDYKLNIKNDDKIIKSSVINGDTYNIDNEIYKDKSTMYTLEIIDNGTIIDSLNLYNLDMYL